MSRAKVEAIETQAPDTGETTPRPPRLTRSQRRAQIRESLVDAAAALFARHGIQATSIEQIAAEAGYTRGAVYSNFADKDDLIVALLDRNLERSIIEVTEVYEQHPDPDTFYKALYARSQHRETNEQDRVLWIEFWLYALRNPAARDKIAPSFATKRAAIAELIEREFVDLQLSPPSDPALMAAVVTAMDEGLALHRRIDPDSYPDSLFFEALSEMMQAAVALARERAADN